jgi:CheY-like chemotaxis protein
MRNAWTRNPQYGHRMKPVTILHVEDDPNLVAMVRLAFANLGFRGEMLHAATVAEARDILTFRIRAALPLDLIIADMNLPDGTGLEVVRRAKSDPDSARIPLLLLSGETDSTTVAEAYALGANGYLAKHDEDLFEVLESTYRFWLRAVVLPVRPDDPTGALLDRCAAYKARAAELYARLARDFADTPARSTFWLGLALHATNQANLIGFLRHSRRPLALPAAPLAELTRYADLKGPDLDRVWALASLVGRPTMDQALGWALEIEATFDPEVLSMLLSAFFPNEPVAVSALKWNTAGYLETLATWAFESGDPRIGDKGRCHLGRAETLGRRAPG